MWVGDQISGDMNQTGLRTLQKRAKIANHLFDDLFLLIHLSILSLYFNCCSVSNKLRNVTGEQTLHL